MHVLRPPLNKSLAILTRSSRICLGSLTLMGIALGFFHLVPATRALPLTEARNVPVSLQVDVPAQQLLRQIRDAYKAAGSLVWAGGVIASIDSAPARSLGLNSSFKRGATKSFRHEQQDGIVFGCDGDELYAYRPDGNTYLQIAASCVNGDLSALPNPIPQVLDICNPSLKLALVPDAAEELRSGAPKIELLPDTTLDGIAYKTLRLTPEIGQRITTLLVDPHTYLLRQAKQEYPADPDEPAAQARSITVDYTTVQVNVPIEASRFAWTPPAGAENVVPPRVTLGRPAPDFRLADLDGKEVQLSSLRGNVVVLDFWATWCGPCRVSLPMLEQVAQDVSSPKLRVFAINRQENPDTLREFARRTNLSLPVLLDPKFDAARKYRVSGIPQTVVIGKDGVVKFITVGIAPENERRLRQSIRLALEAP